MQCVSGKMPKNIKVEALVERWRDASGVVFSKLHEEVGGGRDSENSPASAWRTGSVRIEQSSRKQLLQ